MRKPLLLGLFLLPYLLVEASAADSVASLEAQLHTTLTAIQTTAAEIRRLRVEVANATVAPAPGRGNAGSDASGAPGGSPVASDATGGDSDAAALSNDTASAYSNLEATIELLYNRLVAAAQDLAELKRMRREAERKAVSAALTRPSSLIDVLIAYQELVLLEAEADRELAAAGKELALLAEDSKLAPGTVIKKTGRSLVLIR